MEAFEVDVKVGKANLSGHHEGISFMSADEGSRYDIDGLHEIAEKPGMLGGVLSMHDENGQLTEPIPVAIEEGEVQETKPIKMFLQEHGKQLGAGAATVAVIAVGSLFIRRKLRK